MNTLLRTVMCIISLYCICAHTIAASIQGDPTAELTPSISDTHVTQRYGNWLF